MTFSKWTFTYSQDYQLIKQGENELTAKISCFDNGDSDLNPFPAPGAQTPSSSSPLSEWHTVNVTGVTGAPSAPSPLPLEGNTEGSEEDDEENNNDESNDDDDSNDDVATPMMIMEIMTMMVVVVIVTVTEITSLEETHFLTSRF